MELRLMRGGEVVRRHLLTDMPLYVGRAHHNDICVVDPSVSTVHLCLWRAGEQVHVRDLGSRNGTFVNGKRVDPEACITQGDTVLFGGFEIRLTELTTPRVDATLFVIEDMAKGLCYPMREDRFRIGDDDDADLRLPEEATILRDTGGFVLDSAGSRRPWPVDTPVFIGGAKLRIRPAEGFRATRDVSREAGGYRLMVGFSGGEAQARLVDTNSNRSHRVAGGNRCALLYVLARAKLDDADLDDGGWVHEDDLRIGIWGRDGMDRNLNVLIHRVRKEFEGAGFDSWFLEKERRRARLLLQDIELVGTPARG